MAYADTQTLQQRTAGIAGAALAHAAIGGLILVGLTVKTVIEEVDDEGFVAFDVPTDIPPPPPRPEPLPEPEVTPKKSQIVTPPQPFPKPVPNVLSDTIVEPLPFDNEVTLTVPAGPIPDPMPGLGAIMPIPASPRNDPTRWVTNRDYKSRWIREELSGRATFKLDINAKGRVENCSITRSSGHSALDAATCELISKRARFKPAEGSDGSPTKGIYTSSIRWQLPE